MPQIGFVLALIWLCFYTGKKPGVCRNPLLLIRLHSFWAFWILALFGFVLALFLTWTQGRKLI